MTCFAARCGVHDAAAADRVLRQVAERRLDAVRVSWCDVHGLFRTKTLLPQALRAAFDDGVGMVSTLLLKDTSDRTALKVFDGDVPAGFAGAGNVLMLPDAATFRVLPWAPATGWMQAEPWFADATPVAVDPRRALRAALAELAAAGYTLRCGLEVEFHVYRIVGEQLDPAQAAWPGEPPAVALVHPGWQLLGEAWADMAAEPLAIVQHTALGLGLPLRSVEIELGPSQVECVFDATDAMTAADQMALFRSGVRQALRRAGYFASFVCRPPFAGAMASGWHLHQSLLADGSNAFAADGGALSDCGRSWLAGLLAHARGGSLCAAPTVLGHDRYRPNAMAPITACWGRDNRGAMLRVVGESAATRIENRAGEPMANPYLYVAAQVYAGRDGLRRGLRPPPASDTPYDAGGSEPLPPTLGDAIDAFEADAVLARGFGAPLAGTYAAVKRSEWQRFLQADDRDAWLRREYFSRY